MSYIIWAIIIISVLRAIFSGDPKKKSQNQRARNRAAADTSTGRRPTLEEVTQRKRQELQNLARQQRGDSVAGGRPPADGGADPGNMTMAERIARARAKQQYEQRAAQAGQGRAASASGSASPAPRSAPSRSGTNAQQRRAEALRQKLEARRRQQQQALARRQQQIQQAKAQRPSRPAAPPRRPAPVSDGMGDRPDHEEVHRRVANLEETPPLKIGSARRRSETAASGRGVGLNFAKLSTADLRRAFILKEVLDRPVAERDPLADVSG